VLNINAAIFLQTAGNERYPNFFPILAFSGESPRAAFLYARDINFSEYKKVKNMTLAPNSFSYYYALPDICKEMVYKESFKVLKIEENIPDRVDIETDLIAIIHNINRFYNT
jgi:hypothetical protein